MSTQTAVSSIPMKALDVKLLKITDVKFKKAWTDQQGQVGYYFNIFVSDKEGNSARKEFFSYNEEPPVNLFVIGAYQKIKCVKPDPKADLIEPYLDPEDVKKEDRLRMAQEIANGKESALPKGASEESPQPKPQYQVSDAAGRKSMAVSYAKDLLVVELQTRPRDYRITEGDIERMLGWAKKMNAAFYEA
jgi:hypothetical protein